MPTEKDHCALSKIHKNERRYLVYGVLTLGECRLSVPQPGIELMPPAVEAQSLNHWTAKEIPPVFDSTNVYSCKLIQSIFQLIIFVLKLFLPLLTSLVAQTVKASAYNVGDPGWPLGREDPLEKEMAAHSSTLAWKIPWVEKPSRQQSMGSQRVGHNWATSCFFLLTLYL